MNEYVITKDKALIHHDSALYEGWVECTDIDQLKTYADPSLDVKEGLSKWKAEPIPAELMKRVLGTLARYEHMETGYVIYRDPIHRKWDIRCPAQKGSPAHVNFFEEEHPDHSFQVVGTIHIHPQMSAFWSGTDLADQTKKPGTLHMVFGTSGKHVNKTLCTVFEGGGIKYDIPFTTVCEEVDFSQDYPADEEWCKIIDKQEWTDPNAPKLPSVPSYQNTPAYWNMLTSRHTNTTAPVRRNYTPSYEDNLYDYYDDPLAGAWSKKTTTWYRPEAPVKPAMPTDKTSSDTGLIESLAATCGYAVDLYGLDSVLSTLSEALGVDLSYQDSGQVQDDKGADVPAMTDETSCYDDAFDLVSKMNENISTSYDVEAAVEWLLDYIKENHPHKLLAAADDVAVDTYEEDDADDSEDDMLGL